MITNRPFTVALAAETDLPDILVTQRAAFQREFERTGEPNIDAITQTLDELAKDFRTKTLLVARMDGKIVGTGRAHQEGDSVHINKIAVLEEARAHGIGSAIVQTLEKAFPKAKTFELYTSAGSPDNIRLYQRLGYLVTGTRKASDRLSFVCLEKHPSPIDAQPRNP